MFDTFVPVLYIGSMFIRETVKSKKGKKYVQHQLVESVRTPNGPRQRLLLNMGLLDLARDQWKELANTIESELHGQNSLFSTNPEIEKLAKHYARVLIKERFNKESEKIERESGKEKPEYETVDINSVSTSDSRTIGVEHVVTSSMREYNLDKVLKKLKFADHQIDYSKMLIAGRLTHPASERETARWINENSAICELLKTDSKVYDNALHRTSCLLLENHEEIEQSLSEKAREIFDLEETLILYDLTNTYFEGSKRNSKIAKPGRSKERRNDRPLVTLALTLDSDGFPKQSRILEGNVSEPGTLEDILNELSGVNDGFGIEKTIALDAGIASDENIEIIKKKKFKYVAVSRRRSYPEDFWAGCTEKALKLYDKKTELKVKLVKKDGEAWLHCHSGLKEAKEKAILEKKIYKFEQELKKIRDGLMKKGTRKKYRVIVERIGRIKERYGVGNLYDIEIKQVEGKVTTIEYHKNPKGKARQQKVGDYILRTNRLDLTEEAISKIHRSLTTVEDSFRSMKSHLGLRPIHHKRDDTTTAHIFITVIAYHILAGILKKLHRNGINSNWNTIRNILSTHVRVTTTFKTEDESTINVRNSTTPTIKQQEIYDALAINKQPLRKIKIRTPLRKDRKCSEEK
ncbi:MAG: IS1634 family transposase [Deltaproteobacteria bacterium]|nr:IS1634 family transposase [Deltaproteobacteria bacterium]